MESVERFVVEQLAAWEVPGCAVAAVRDGQVVLAAGWGQRDLDTKLPVTANSLFAIGSTTKAFTAATVGALVDDGLLEWERPLGDYVPEIRLHDPVAYSSPSLDQRSAHRRLDVIEKRLEDQVIRGGVSCPGVMPRIRAARRSGGHQVVPCRWSAAPGRSRGGGPPRWPSPAWLRQDRGHDWTHEP